jgi:hypothetical protein
MNYYIITMYIRSIRISNIICFRILLLLNKRKLEKLKEIWWNQNPEKKKCDKQDNQTDGISIHNIGETGVLY